MMRETTEISGDVGGTRAIRENGSERGSWKDAALAGLPHLLLGLILGLPGLLRATGVLAPYTQGIPVSETLLDVGLAATIIPVLVTAWRRGWPRWSASWTAYGLVVVALPLVMLVQDGTTPTLLSGALMFVAIPLALAWLLYGVTRRDRLKGLLAALPVVTAAWHPILEFVPFPTRASVLLGGWLVTALAAAAILRLGRVRAGVWLVIGVSLLVGLPFSYARTYLHAIPAAHAAEPTVWGVVHRLAPQWLASSTLVIGPRLAWALRELGKRSARMGMLSYRVALLGVLLNLAGNLGACWLATGHALWPYRQPGDQTFTAMIVLSVLIYLSGSGCLGVASLRSGTLPGGVVSVLLLLIPLGLPLVVMLNPIHLDLAIRMLRVNDIPRGLVYAAGLTWLLLGGWVVTRRGLKTPTPRATAG